MAELDIAAFLRARLDERERRALAATPGPWESEGDDPTDDEIYTVHDGEHGDLIGNVVAFVRNGGRDGCQQPNTVHIADNDPTFVLADVVAKRQIVWEHGDNGMFKHDDNGDLVRAGPLGDRCTSCLLTDDPLAAEAGSEFAEMAPYPCRTLRLLALPYAGHPQYDEAWRP